MDERPSWAPDEVDISRPSVARVYDYYLGGSHNFAADREFAATVLAALPDMPRLARHNRFFLQRAVQHLCRGGITQFLDLGSGIPSVGNVHDVALAADAGSSTVYVDHDPVAVAHGRALLGHHPSVAVVQHDLRDPEAVLADAAVRGRLDLRRPVAVLFVAVLHFVTDDTEAAAVVRRYLAALPVGSHVVISHASADGQSGAAALADLYNRPGSPNPIRMRSREQVTALFGELELLPPGVVRMPLWRPDQPADVPNDVNTYPGYGGVARSVTGVV